MVKGLRKSPRKRRGGALFNGLAGLPVEAQDKFIQKLQSEHIEKMLEYEDRNWERVFRFCCLFLFVGVFIFTALWVANLNQQIFVWVSLGILVLALVVLGAKDLLKKYLPPGG